MRGWIGAFVALLPVTTLGQYVGNPAGKARPLGAVHGFYHDSRGFAGIEGGYTNLDVDAKYNTTSDILREVSTFRESYFALYGGGNVHGFEVEAKIGGAFQDVEEKALTEHPFEDGGGVLVGAGARWGVSPVEFLRFGLGGQFLFTYNDGEAIVSDGFTVSLEDVDMEVYRGDLFTGLGLDLPLGADVTLSPYGGIGAQFIDGEISIESWSTCCWTYRERLGDFDEERIEFFFGGLDIHVRDEFRISVEGRGNGAGWAVTASVGWSFW